jgi:hypothetical protein
LVLDNTIRVHVADQGGGLALGIKIKIKTIIAAFVIAHQLDRCLRNVLKLRKLFSEVEAAHILKWLRHIEMFLFTGISLDGLYLKFYFGHLLIWLNQLIIKVNAKSV